MLRPVARMLIALAVALAVAMPAGATMLPMSGKAMSMAADMIENSVDQPCQNCPGPHQQGGMEKMPGCPAFTCTVVPAVLPGALLITDRVAVKAGYLRPVAAYLAGADPAPDPFPPRPVVIH
jgi:hypothetical protein